MADRLRGARALLRGRGAALPRARRGRARTRPTRRARAHSRTRRSRTSRASSSSTTISSRTGHHPFHLPVGVDLNESDPEAGRCVRCDRFDGFPCLTDGKADAHVLCVRPALAAPERARSRPTPRSPGSRPTRAAADGTGVVVDRRGATETYTADVVVVSCGAAESPALLLRSANDRHPNGLGELVRPGGPQLHGAHQLRRDRDLPDAEHDEVPEDARRERLLLGRARLGAAAGAHPDARQVATATSCAPARRGSRRAWRSTTWPGTRSTSGSRPRTCPHPDNRVTVDREGTIHLSKTFHNEEPHRRLLAKLKGLLGDLGCSERPIPRFSVLDQRIPLAGIAHQCGTVRFGDDPATSVLDGNCKAHDLDNLYVVDTSFFPSSSAVNPALTAMANALRVGDHLIERLGGRPPPGARRREPARRWRHEAPAQPWARRRRDRQGPRRRLRRHGRDDGLEHARGEAARPCALARRRPAPPPRCSGSRSSRTRSRRRASTTSRTGATAPDGASSAACSARPGCRGRAATAAHGAAIYGAAQVTLPALEIAPPLDLLAKEEIAIDAFHHAVYPPPPGWRTS